MKAESVKRANRELDTFLTQNTAAFGSDEAVLNFIRKNIDKVTDKDYREYNFSEERRQQLLRVLGLRRALSAEKFKVAQAVTAHEHFEKH